MSYEYYDSDVGISVDEVLKKPSIKYPAANEALCALLVNDELMASISNGFPDIIMPGYFVYASVDGKIKQKYCLKISAHHHKNGAITAKISLHPHAEKTRSGVIAVCSQFMNLVM